MPSPSIRSEVSTAGKWSAIATVLTTLIFLARSIVLARLLSPAELGLFAMAMLAVSLFRSLADGGMANAIIYKQTTDKHILSSIHWINVALGVVVCGLICLCAPLFAAYFRKTELVPVVIWLSLGAFVSSWSIVMLAVLRTEMRFRSICIVQVSCAILALLVSVLAAAENAGVYAIVYGYLVSAIAEVGLTYWLAVSYSRPRLIFRLAGLGEYVRFGGFQLGERFLNFLSANADYFIIGRVLGDEALGLYRIAYELVVMPLNRINPVVTRVVLPGFAKLKSPERIRGAYLEVLRLLSCITIPCLFGLWAIAPLFVEMAYDTRYQYAAELVRILILVGVLKTLCNPIGVAIVAMGRPDIGFYWNLALLIVSVVLFSALAPFGSWAVAWGYVGLTCVSFFVLNGPVLRSLLEASLGDVAKQIWLPLLLSASMAGVVHLASLPLAGLSNAAPKLVILIAVGVVYYVISFLVFDRTYVDQILRLIRNRS